MVFYLTKISQSEFVKQPSTWLWAHEQYLLYAFKANELYCIAGKFGGNNVWQKWMDVYIFGKESLANEYVDQNAIDCDFKYG